MNQIAIPSGSAWYAEGLRWIGSLFNSAADSLERARASCAPDDEFLPYEDFLSDVRLRIQNRYY